MENISIIPFAQEFRSINCLSMANPTGYLGHLTVVTNLNVENLILQIIVAGASLYPGGLLICQICYSEKFAV